MYSGFYNENILKSRLDIVGLGFLANQLGTALRKGATHIGIDSTVLCGHQIVATAAEDRQRIYYDVLIAFVHTYMERTY